ncbi:cytochrome P450 [Thelonectria olida]|uniref:Cytochrome P450 n=1 Tax=Thelonectria olida TaxID=1576542 RepID=A0A9P8VPF5_9HYPO|nr:cytochrome P450 [Thelonectria olida]
MTSLSITAAFLVAVLLVKYFFLDALFLSTLRHVPGPKFYALTKWRLAYEDWKGTRTRTLNHLHLKYGPAVRIGPNEVSFNSLTALRSIYGPGSRYGRTAFYRMFDVYDEQNLFTFHTVKEHGDRKKLVSHAYSKSVVLKEPTTRMVEEKTRQYLELIEHEPEHVSDIFTTLHFYSLDNITEFVYGKYGSTSALQGSKIHQALIADIMHPSRRKLSWFLVHFPAFTKWLYTRPNLMGQLVRPLLPMQQPTTYTGIRKFALQAFKDFRSYQDGNELSQKPHEGDASILTNLWKHHQTQKADGINDMQMASECADHFLAGIDTTSDTLMFLVWSLSLPANKKFQDKLRDELLKLPEESLNQYGFPKADLADRCTYLNAVVKETLRLHAPLPSSEPRSLDAGSVIDDYAIPADTVVGISPFILHRNPKVFKDPLMFNPDRWLGPDAPELNRWFWAFSSGGRMCIGMHLAMVEMSTLAATLYREYETLIAPGFEGISPGITARVEVFYDECLPQMQEHTCLIKFNKLKR